jgi:UDPglucose--hexose-1-phosphate uridylyltransferase
MPELRKNPITREWVIIATERSRRPVDFHVPSGNLASTSAHDSKCPFCPGNEFATPPEVLAFRGGDGGSNTPGWSVRVVSNKFPALGIEGDLARRGTGIYDAMNGVGAHEVVIETPQHNESLATIPAASCAEVLWAIRERFVDLARDRRFKYILFFKNQGRAAGASLEHPHSQIIALPILPREILTEIEGMNLYSEYRDRCPYCDMVQQEQQSDDRVVLSTANYLVFAPFAARTPFETWIVPRHHQAAFTDLQRSDMDDLAIALQGVLGRLDRCLDTPPYNLALHTQPVNSSRPDDFHWHIQISPRLTIAAGFEMGTGVYINVTSPEEAARFLREAQPAAAR